MVGFILSTATADTAARAQFIQVTAIEQNQMKRAKNRPKLDINDPYKV